MQTEKIQISLSPETPKAEVIIREVNEVNELPILAPIKPDISGVLGAPLEFLQKRKTVSVQINQHRCHILVDREKMSITLVTNEHDQYLCGKITGKATVHPKFAEFGINTGKGWEPNELGQFFKMNRASFVDKSENMAIVTQLKNFEAKVNTQIVKQKSENGDFADNYSGVVMSNLPGAFKLKIPLFKGRAAEEIEVEFYASVNGRTVALQLYSPGANQAIEEIRDAMIEDELARIREICEDIAIIEQ